jgi:hypothetical protein
LSKAKLFFELFDDIPGAVEHQELDSRDLFTVVMSKLKEISPDNNLKLESVLFDVLLRVVQRGLMFFFFI